MGRKKSVGNGEGSVVALRRKGKIVGYAPEITIGWEGGKRIRKRGEVKSTRGEARDALDELKRLLDAGVDLTAKEPKVGEFFSDWLMNTFARKGRPRSIDTYRWAVDKVIVPHLGDLSLKKVRTMRLDRLFANLLDGTVRPDGKKLAPKSVMLVRTVLRQGFRQARKWGLIKDNPVTDTEAPQVSCSRAKALSSAQARAFLNAARGDRLDFALRLCLALGLRRGEVCGLRKEDLDLESGTITINGTLGYVKDKGLLYGPPKTESARRSFKLPTVLLAALRWHLTRLEAERMAMGAKWKEDCGYIFVTASTGAPLNPSTLYKAFRDVADRAGIIGYRLHDLRHSCASFLHAEHVPVKNISVYLGHADTYTTNSIYVHLFPDALNDAAEVVEQHLESSVRHGG